VIFKEQKKYVANVADKLKKQNLLIKYDALKHQIDPHFLFNGLNVLAALMKKDKPLAEQFIQRLSEVYRYVLELNKVEFVTLNEELDFIDSYLFMQKLRYNNTILVSKSIKNSDLNKLVPPMALQVIVENALKHNEISAAKPLRIRINSSDGYVVVSNSYNPKETLKASTGLGQKNIIERYQLIDSKLPQFYVEEQKYVAKLPLIQVAKSVVPQTAAISNAWAVT
ncbi:MAG: histidine kinase, partial [Bacteroidota bacterium]